MNGELRTPPSDWPASWGGKAPNWATAPEPRRRPERQPAERPGHAPTRDQIADMVVGARSINHDHVHFEIRRTRRDLGACKQIRLLGKTGPFSSEDKKTEMVRTHSEAGRTNYIWSAWWRTSDLEAWLRENPE